MDLQTRKISFVQEFLSIESEELISRLENFLKKEKKVKTNKEFSPMTMEESQNRINQSEQDSINGRLTEMNDFLAEIKKWD
jgi:anionic cell wall polymer biosynthesis LytR-Cps2A-Psr (LCP) family protein